MDKVRRWISPKECSERLAIHPQTIYEMFARGELPGGRIGRCVRLDWLKIEQRLEGQADCQYEETVKGGEEILGALVLRPALLEVSDLTANDFTPGRERDTFLAIAALYEDMKPAMIDPVLLWDTFGGNGSEAYVAELALRQLSGHSRELPGPGRQLQAEDDHTPNPGGDSGARRRLANSTSRRSGRSLRLTLRSTQRRKTPCVRSSAAPNSRRSIFRSNGRSITRADAQPDSASWSGRPWKNLACTLPLEGRLRGRPLS